MPSAFYFEVAPYSIYVQTVAQTWSYTATAPVLQALLRTATQTESWTTASVRLQQSLRTAAQTESWAAAAPRLQQFLRSTTQTEAWTTVGSRLLLLLRFAAQAESWSTSSAGLQQSLRTNPQAEDWTATAPQLQQSLGTNSQVWADAGILPRLSALLSSNSFTWDWAAQPPILPATYVQTVLQAWGWTAPAPQLSASLVLAPQPWSYAGAPVDLQSVLTTVQQPWSVTGLPPQVGAGAQVVTAAAQAWPASGVAPRVLGSYGVRLPSSRWSWPSQPAALSRVAPPPPVQPVRNTSFYAVWAGASGLVPPEDPPDPAVVEVWSNPSRVLFEGSMPAAVVYLPNSPYIAGTTFPVYGKLVDIYGAGIPASNFVSLTLTIFDTLTGIIINDVSNVSILNVDRGTVDGMGNLVIQNQPGDTSMSEVPGAASVQRSYALNWVYNQAGSSGIGAFIIGSSPIGGAEAALVGAQEIRFTLVNMMPTEASTGFIIGVSPIGVGPIG